MTAHRFASAALVGVVPLLIVALGAGPVQAHGAPTDPVGRVVACGPEGEQWARSAACGAAVAANGGQGFDDWDNLRVAGVGGRDREVVPDGRLCSAGIDAYKGLDIARADWPATRLRAGTGFTLTYRSTIAHRGTFTVYLTKQGYDPAAPLRWADLDPEPFMAATDPELEDGSYRITGRLPAGRTGRHVLYTVWRNTDTPDTYYSCSDVDFSASGSAEAPAVEPASAARGAERDVVPLIAVGAAVLALIMVGASVLLRRRLP